MKKILFGLTMLTTLIVVLLYLKSVIYFPSDILNLFPFFNSGDKQVPHNSLVSDPLTQFEPWRILVKQQILTGQFPLWNPYNAGGVPLFANAQSAVLFPLNFLYYIFPVNISLNLISALKVLALFLFAYLFLNYLKLKPQSVLLGSIIITFSAFPIVWNLWPHSNVFIFLPLFLYLIERILCAKKEIFVWYSLLSLTVCMAIFGGHYETLLHIIILVFIYSIYRIRDLGKLTKVIFFLVLGVILASIQVFPFLEYFLNSLVINERVHSQGLYLPPESFVLNIVPFILGAPHIAFYKSISPLTNFQEAIGGYTSAGVFLLAIIYAILSLKRLSVITFWFFNAVFFTMLSYKIWPVGIFLELPLISQAQNGRFSSIAAFATSMIFIYLLENVRLLPKFFYRNAVKLILTTFILAFISIIAINSISSFVALPQHPFVLILLDHLSFLILSTSLIVIVMLLILINGFSKLLLFILTIGILLQSAFLFINYIPLTSVVDYYPENAIIKKLKSLPRGPILEIGNPSIIPNINLAYGIVHAQNYDAIEVGSYARAFNKSFDKNNHWNKVEEVDIAMLRKFGIKYLISDYNLNFIKQELQPEKNFLIGPIFGDVFELEFIPKYNNLAGIRILPANYNRKNTCNLNVEILTKNFHQVVASKTIPCSDLLDKMYKTIAFLQTLSLDAKQTYLVRISSSNTAVGNAVGLWGNDSLPYLVLLFDAGKSDYNLILETDNAKLFEVPNSYQVEYSGEHTLIFESPTRYFYKTKSKNSGEFIFKKTNFPGWKVKVDSRETSIDTKSPFLAFRVPPGEHIVTIEYVPIVFKIGIIVSVITLLFLCIYIVRGLKVATRSNKKFLLIGKQIKDIKTNVNSKSIFTFVLIVAICQIFLSSFIYNLNITLFRQDYYPVINWLSINNYSIYDDYLKVLLYFLSILASFIFGATYLIWRK